MVENLTVELVAKYDHVLAVARKEPLIWISRVPDACLTHEVKPGAVDNCGALSLGVCTKENGCAKDPLECGNETAILRSALLHAEGVQHLRRAVERNSGSLLPNGECRKENGY